MDRTRASEARGAGSIPAEGTVTKKHHTVFFCWFYLSDFLEHRVEA